MRSVYWDGLLCTKVDDIERDIMIRSTTQAMRAMVSTRDSFKHHERAKSHKQSNLGSESRFVNPRESNLHNIKRLKDHVILLILSTCSLLQRLVKIIQKASDQRVHSGYPNHVSSFPQLDTIRLVETP